MTTIHLITKIKAPIQIVFDLSRDIDIHKRSIGKSNEKAIAGVTSGKIGLNETVTFRGKHFGIYLNHQSKITEMEDPNYFADEMIKGHFKFFRHEHSFVTQNGKTVMIDLVQYETPFGIFGKLLDKFTLKNYMTNLIRTRNEFLKNLAENQGN